MVAVPDALDEEIEAELVAMRKAAAHVDRIRFRQQQGLVTKDQAEMAETLAWVFGVGGAIDIAVALVCWFSYGWHAWPVYATGAGLWAVSAWAAARCWRWKGQ